MKIETSIIFIKKKKTKTKKNKNKNKTLTHTRKRKENKKTKNKKKQKTQPNRTKQNIKEGKVRKKLDIGDYFSISLEFISFVSNSRTQRVFLFI